MALTIVNSVDFVVGLELWQRHMIPYGKKPDGTCDDETEQGCQLYGHIQLRQPPIYKAAGDACHGVNLFSKYHGFVVEQDIAYHPTGRTSDAPHYYCHPKRLPIVEAFLYAGYGEQRQAQGVEHKPGILEPLHALGAQYHHAQCQSRTYNIYGICHPERRSPEHDVAYRTAANGHGNATHVAAKPIEVLGRRMPDAGDGKGKSTQKLDELLGSGYGNVVVHHPTTLMGSPLAKAFMFSTAVFINRPRASRVAHAT